MVTRHRERGQVLVVFAGGVIVLLVIAALVIDIGMVFMIRRHEQNAADPGAVAAARYVNPTADVASMWTAACFYAIQNGFRPTRTDNGNACDASVGTDGSRIAVHFPPSAQAGAFAGDTDYVEVAITSQHQSFLAGVVGLPRFTVTTSAVAANDDGAGGASSLVALAPTGCGTAKINGGGSGGGIRIFPAAGVTDPGGYIQVNSNCASGSASDDVCNGSSGGFIMNGGTLVEAPALYVQGACGWTGTSGTMVVPVIDEGASYVGDPLALVRPPSPGDLPTMPCPGQPSSKWGTPTNPQICDVNGTVTLSPGTYYGGWKIGNGTNITLQPGIYIMAGGGISQTGGSLSSATGRVMIYSTDAPNFRTTCLGGGGTPAQCQGDLDVRGTGSLSLRGLSPTDPCPPYSTTGCPFGGMLLWEDGTGSGAGRGNADIDIGGGSALFVSGTIYTAGGEVNILGNNNSSGCTSGFNCASVQIIANTFQIGGSAILDMPYDPSGFYKTRLKGLVQ